MPMIHKKEDFEPMRKAGALAARTLDFIGSYVDVGVSTGELDRLCHKFIVDNGAIPAPLNYKGFPKSICTSVNHVVCHGIPSDDKILEDGDCINIDVTVILDGWHGDTSRMYAVGKVPLKARRLMEVTHDAMMLGIEAATPGNTLGHIGEAIQKYAESYGYSVVRDFCGHSIGRVFHGDMHVLHYGKKGEGEELVEGMFFTVEPMINAGGLHVKILPDGWTAVTKDRSLSAQYEHTIGITSVSNEIFTLSHGNK